MENKPDFFMAAAEKLTDISPLLLDWYDRNARKLPWRESRDPYRIWISEIMLQQTRVEAVIPYYQRFLEQLPDIEALARVPEEQLLKLWEGLGYYTRAKNLQKAARMMMEQHSGRFPENFDAIRALPGIGPYTAGAIGSIAFELPAPAVDGNVLRVLARLTCCPDDIARPDVKAGMTRLLGAIFPKSRRGDFTQSVMELGATVCLPNGAPDCAACPISGYCGAYRTGTQENYPMKAPKKARRQEKLTVLLLLCDGRVAVRKRPEGGLLGGLWEFPCVSGFRTAEKIPALVREWGLTAESVRQGPGCRHIFTHVQWEMCSFVADVREAGGEFVWATPRQLREEIALPGAFHPLRNFLFSLWD